MRLFLFIAIVGLLALSSCATRVVSTAPNSQVTIVKTAPRNHKIVVVKGKRYYYWNGNHYSKTRRGYIRVVVR